VVKVVSSSILYLKGINMFVEFANALSSNTEGLFGGIVDFITGLWDAFGGLFNSVAGSSLEDA
jgi:hypothetical protein